MSVGHVLRYVAAMVYDTLAVIAIVFFASMPIVAALGGENIRPGNLLYQLYLFAIIYLYFVTCWTRGGRTLGMQAWKLQVVTAHGSPPGLAGASGRFLGATASLAACGLGHAWALIDSDRRTWPDLLSDTRVRRYSDETAKNHAGPEA